MLTNYTFYFSLSMLFSIEDDMKIDEKCVEAGNISSW